MARTYGMRGVEDAQLVKYALNCCDKVKMGLELLDHDYDAFLSNVLLQDGIAKNIADIGELFNSFSDDIRERFVTDQMRRRVKGLRNALDHEYPLVDAELVWQSAKDYIPEVEEVLFEIQGYLRKNILD